MNIESGRNGVSTSSSAEIPSEHRSNKLLITSNLFFVAASIFYLVGAILDYQMEQEPVEIQGVNLSWLMVVLGALGFVVVGSLDWYNTQKNIHVFLILAGIFGTLNAILIDSNLTAALVFNLLSTHLFLVESLQWLYGRFTTELKANDSRHTSLVFAEFGALCFFAGACLDVIFSYYQLVNQKESYAATQNMITVRVALASSFLWLVASFVSLAVACRLGKQGFEGACTGSYGQGEITKSGTMA